MPTNTILVASKGEKQGSNARGPWSLYTITALDGSSYKTFRGSVFENAGVVFPTLAQGTALKVEWSEKDNPGYSPDRIIESIEVVGGEGVVASPVEKVTGIVTNPEPSGLKMEDIPFDGNVVNPYPAEIYREQIVSNFDWANTRAMNAAKATALCMGEYFGQGTGASPGSVSEESMREMVIRYTAIFMISLDKRGR